MKKLFIYLFLFLFLLGCKKAEKQKIILKNKSSENIYFLLSKEKTLTSMSEISDLAYVIPIQKSDYQNATEDIKQNEEFNPYQHFINKGGSTTIMTSESAGIFLNSITIQSIIKDRFNGVLNVFIITESKMIKYSEQEIIEKKLYDLFKSLTVNDINNNEIIIDYK